MASPTPDNPFGGGVTIIGAGAMGTVTALMLASKGVSVAIWHIHRARTEELVQSRENRRYLPGHPIPETVRLTLALPEALRGAGLVINAVPTQYIRSVWGEIAAHPAWQSCVGVPVLSVAKGLEQGSLLRPTEIIVGQTEPSRAVCALSGPGIGPELARCLPTTLVAASPDAELADRVRRLLSTDYLRIYTNTDLLGVELAGAAKNVIAIAAGILDGLRCGDNAKAGLLTRGLAEITRLGVALGARPDTFAGLAGVGDLITTAFSPIGRNRRVGEQIGRGRQLSEILADSHHVAEGVDSARSLVALARRSKVEMPIAEAVHAVLFEGKHPITAISELMARPPQAEHIGSAG